MNQLDQLRSMTVVVADTGDIDAIAKYKPTDATTNPSLLLAAAKMPKYRSMASADLTKHKARSCSEAQQLAMLCDRFAVRIGCEILKIVDGRISTEVDARLSFDRDASIQRARRLVQMYDEAGIDRSRLLIKLASTWEGIQAAAMLESDGINCNLTLLFCDVQAVAAAEAGAYLISPFVGRILDWHIASTGSSDFSAEEDPGVLSVSNIYRMYKSKDVKTVVMGASFRNIGEIQALAGCDRLTIAPSLLKELAENETQLDHILSPTDQKKYVDCNIVNEADFRLQLNANAMATEKLAEGIRGFVRDQIELEQTLGVFL
jgi:transaldolase